MLTIQIFHADPGTSEFEELELLLVLVKDYEDKHIVIPELEFQLNDDRNCAVIPARRITSNNQEGISPESI